MKISAVIAAIVAAVITPSQDAFSMLAMFLPLYVLYEVSVVLARFVQPKPEGDLAEGPGPDDPDDGTLVAPA